MLTKTKIALSTLLVVGFASAALAAETPENKIGDRYPFLEQTYQQSAGTSAFASAAVRHSVNGFASAALAGEVPEGRIGDRYPQLEQTYQQSAGASAFAYAAVRHSVNGFTAAEQALFARAKGTW